MPLIKETNDKMVPDSFGGWYWLKLKGTEEWRPVKVHPASNGWPAYIIRYSHQEDVAKVEGEWGPEIVPPT